MSKLSLRPVIVVSLALVLAGCAAAAGPSATPTQRSDYKLGVILNAGGSIHDGTFNETSYNGATLAARDFGLNVAEKDTIEDKDYPAAIDAMITDGRNIIVTVGFPMQQATLDAAQKYPKAYFIGVDEGAANAPTNFVGVQFKEDQGGFLAGALAGMMTKSNVVGVIGGVQIPPVQRFVSGFINGVHYVNPTANALSVFTTDFSSPEQGRTNADKMIAQNADVIFGAGGLTGSSGIAEAAAKKVYVIGVDQDEFRTTFVTGTNADYILTSAVKRADTGVYNVIRDILNNKVDNDKNKTLGAADCGISYAPFHNADKTIPDAVKTRLEAIWRALAGGTLMTGAGDGQTATPPALAAGAMPTISDTAPKLSDCTRS